MIKIVYEKEYLANDDLAIVYNKLTFEYDEKFFGGYRLAAIDRVSKQEYLCSSEGKADLIKERFDQNKPLPNG